MKLPIYATVRIPKSIIDTIASYVLLAGKDFGAPTNIGPGTARLGRLRTDPACSRRLCSTSHFLHAIFFFLKKNHFFFKKKSKKKLVSLTDHADATWEGIARSANPS